jgi:hypothetical protein
MLFPGKCPQREDGEEACLTAPYPPPPPVAASASANGSAVSRRGARGRDMVSRNRSEKVTQVVVVKGCLTCGSMPLQASLDEQISSGSSHN